MVKKIVWFKTLSTGLIGFCNLSTWNEMNYGDKPDYQICYEGKGYWEMSEIVKKHNRAIHAMGGNKINKIIEEIRALKSLDGIEILIEKIKRL